MGRWSWFILLFSIIVPTAAVPWIAALSTQSLLLPPVVRLGFAGGAQALQKDCEARSLDGCIWGNDVTEGYQVARVLFQTLAAGRNCLSIWFPRLSDTDVLGGLVRVVNNNADRLGGVKSEVLAWPRLPATEYNYFGHPHH
ncbi:hypothetical protein MHU86_25024 [Fragilaria crotonensis]|nr:hypothetical protein MHU86_25024 [Fragilaria crotonensis]